MEYDFFWISGSPFAWRVHLALEAKGIRYRSFRLKADEGEHKSPEFLALNPHGKVPVLKVGETIIYESVAILAYLEIVSPKLPLFGTSHAETALIWQRVQEIENYARNPLLRFSIDTFSGELGRAPEILSQILALCHEQIAWVEGILSHSLWMAGAQRSAADLVLYPALKIFLRAAAQNEGGIDPVAFAKQYPANAHWMAQVEALPGYSKTYPPHWDI